jgi:hypothetical protein
VRLSVIGCSGAGKTTFARAAAARLGVAFIELDAIRHQANWRELPDPEFRARVAPLLARETWVCDGSYRGVDSLVRARATDVAWLDPSKLVVMAQVIGRSFSRALLRAELWNGNRETFAGWLDSGHPIPWAWRRFGTVRVEYARRIAEDARAGVRVHRLCDRRSARAFLDGLDRASCERPWGLMKG